MSHTEFAVFSERRARFVALVTLVALAIGIPQPIYALDFGKLLRKIGRVSDDVPIKRIDDVVQDAAISRAGREMLEKAGTRMDDAVGRTKALRKAWREVIGDADVSLLKQIDALDEPTQQAALVLARGARRIESEIPDLASRSRFMKEGGGETVAALGRYDDLTDDAIRFDVALSGGRLPSPAGALTLSDFGKFIYKQGDRGQHFWVTSVRPHWKLWVGSTALAAVMLAPDEYLDDLGNVTRDGLKKLGARGGKLLGGALAGAVEGLGEGTKTALRETWNSTLRTFLSSALGVGSFLLLACAAILATPFTWKWVSRFLIRIARSNRTGQADKTDPKPQAKD